MSISSFGSAFTHDETYSLKFGQRDNRTGLISILFCLCLSSNCYAQIITTIAGGGTILGDNGPGINAKLITPAGIAVDQSGNVYFGDVDDNRVRKVDSNGIITTFAGTGFSGFSGDGGPASSARLNSPTGVAIDPTGNLYIADARNHCIRKVAPNGIISRFAGTGFPSFSGDGGPAINADIPWPVGVSTDAVGNVYIVASGRIRKVNSSGIISTIAGVGGTGFSGDGGPATAAIIQYGYSVDIDAKGNVYIADWSNNRIRRVNQNGIISTIAGTGANNFSGDGGPAINAEFTALYGICLDAAENIYVSDYFSERIRKISSGIVTTVAGIGTPGFGGDGGSPLNAQFFAPSCIEIGPSGNLYIVDRVNARVRKVTCNPPTITVKSSDSLICAGETAILTASGGMLYGWTPNGSSATIAVNPSTSTIYTVSGVNAEGCVNKAFFTQSVNACTDVGNKTNVYSFKAFPNPTKDQLFIQVTKGHIYDYQFVLLNPLGQIILTFENQEKLDLTFLDKGVYYLKGSDANHQEIIKVFKD